jgi:hypothetical protein
MSFLAPLFLLGLAGLAIPVLIHLIQRERKQVVHFPSLMFVRRVPYQSIRRRRIHNWTLLFVRLAALLLLVAAFSRPFLSRPDATAAPGTGAREVVILLDQSYSMAYGDHWERARTAARDAVNALTSSDRASIVLFSSAADVAVRSTSERGRLQSALATAEPSAGSTRYAPALKVAGSILSESTLPRREAILISDFQASGWRGAEGARLPEGATLTPVAIGAREETQNLSASPVSLARTTFEKQERVAVTAGVLNRGTRPVRGVELTLDIGGRAIESERVDVEPSGSASVTFAPVTIASRNMRGTIRLASDALERDNSFHFVVSPAVPVRVLVVERSGATGGASLYLTRALSIGTAPRFEAEVRRADGISDDDLRQASVVLLNDVTVTEALASRLGRFVERGGGLFVALGPYATWAGSSSDVLPGVIGAPVDRSRGDAARVAALEYGHPVFEPFRTPRSGNFSAARFYGYRGLTLAPAAQAQILARFDAGTPAVVERKLGNGRVIVWASTLDLSWSDLPLKPVFLPFIHRVVRHLGSYTEAAPWMTVGQVLDPLAGVTPGTATGERIALTPSRHRVALAGEGPEVLELAEQGFYEIRRQASDADATVVASNVDLTESDLTAVDPKEVVAAAVGRAGEATGAAAAALPLTPEAQERAQRIWWYLLWAAILLLGVDTLLSNRLSKT